MQMPGAFSSLRQLPPLQASISALEPSLSFRNATSCHSPRRVNLGEQQYCTPKDLLYSAYLHAFFSCCWEAHMAHPRQLPLHQTLLFWAYSCITMEASGNSAWLEAFRSPSVRDFQRFPNLCGTSGVLKSSGTSWSFWKQNLFTHDFRRSMNSEASGSPEWMNRLCSSEASGSPVWVQKPLKAQEKNLFAWASEVMQGFQMLLKSNGASRSFQIMGPVHAGLMEVSKITLETCGSVSCGSESCLRYIVQAIQQHEKKT